MLDANARFWLPLFTDAAGKSALVLGVTLFLWAMMRQTPAASRHLTLLTGIVVLLGLPLLMPFVPRQALPPAFSRHPSAPTRPRAATITASSLPTLLFGSAPPMQVSSSRPPPAPRTVTPKQTPLSHYWMVWLLLAWLGGVLIATLRVLIAHWRVWRLICGCPPFPTAFLEALGPELGHIALLRLGPVGTPPLVWGGLRPILLLPSDALAWPSERLRAVLLHEQAHLERRDWMTQTLTQAVCALYWFNPLVWLTACQIQAEAERACDDAVLLAGVPSADYAQSLLAVARSLTATRAASAGAVTMARRSPVRGRLEAILDTARPRGRATRRAVASSLLAALAVTVPLAALRPAARASQPRASHLLTSAEVPTASETAAVRQHFQNLEQERADYAAAHPPRQQKIRAAVMPFLTDSNQGIRVIAKQVLNKYGSHKPFPLPLTQTTSQKGTSPMTPPKNTKTALRTATAFTSLVAALTLNAVSARTATPVPPPAIPKAAETFVTTKIPLQNLVPETVLSLLHWNGGSTLPKGVKQIRSLPKENALLVVATSAGLTQIQETIKAVDVAPRQVEVKLALASVPKTNLDAFGVNFVLVPESEPQGMPTNALLYLDGNIAAELLQAFTKQNRAVASPAITTSSNVEASMSITGSQPTPARPTLDSLTVTPRVNSDDTVILQLQMTISFAGAGRQRRQINTMRTIRSGDTLALCVAPPKPAGRNDHALLLFITPAIVGVQSATPVTIH